MKLLILLTVAACFQAQARGYGQTINISVDKVPIEVVFKEIAKQTGFSFIYTRSQLSNTLPVTLEIKNGYLTNVLEKCFSSQPLSYVLEDRYIIVINRAIPSIKEKSDFPQLLLRGRVVNEMGQGISGASIRVKGTNNGTVSDNLGNFELFVPSLEITLIISSVNTETLELPVQGKSDLNSISVKTLITSLDAVVINKGYYSTSRRLNTGSVEKVNSEEILKQPVSNPISALQGRVPGLLITQRNGLPGSNLDVQIRGQNSIQQGNEPLFIIDGVPFSSENLVRSGISLNASNPFNTLNPADIESIEVLKDADATAIYGSRGANGVILITTKKGKAGNLNVNINLLAGWSKASRTMEYLNTKDYLLMRNEAFKNDQVEPDLSNAPDLLAWDTTRYIDWKEMILGGTASTQNIQARIQGGNNSLNYTFNTGYYTEGSVLPGDFKYSRGSLNFNIQNNSADKKFSATFSGNYTFDKNNLSSQDLTSFINLPPNMYPPFDSLGRLIWSENGFSYGNPFAVLKQEYQANSDRLISNLNLTYRVTDRIAFRTNFNYNSIIYNQYSTRPIASQNPAFNPRGSANFNNTQSKIWNIEPQVDYGLKFTSKGTINFLIGSTFQEKKDNGIYLSGTGYTNDAQITSIVGAGTINVQNDYALYRYSSVFGRVNINWDDKLLFNGVARSDASSRFGPSNRVAQFGAIGIGWIFSKANFFKGASEFLSFGKLRGSWGITGNDKIGDYQYLDTWINTATPYQNQLGLRPTRLFNENYGWEQIEKINLGIDLGFLNNKINLVGDLYRHRSSNQLVSYSLPDQTGFTSVVKNIPGVIENKGIEFSLSSINYTSKIFSWRSSANITFQKNTLLEFEGLEQSNYSGRYIIGKPLNLLIGYNYLGVDIQEGVYQFEDLNKDGLLNTEDLIFQGTTDPVFYGGFNNNIQYKNFELSFLFEFRKQKGRHAIFGYSNIPVTLINQPIDVLNRWQKSGDQAIYQKFTQSFGTSASGAAALTSNSGAALTDASFIRLKNVALYYNIPINIFKTVGISSGKIFLQGQNLVTITRYIGADPENQNLQALPPLRTIVFGINVNL